VSTSPLSKSMSAVCNSVLSFISNLLLPPILSARKQLRSKVFSFLDHFAALNDTKLVFSKLLRSQNVACTFPALTDLRSANIIYPDLGQPQKRSPTRFRDDTIFVTGRFRSGSTLLWNIFRSIPSVTAYYEPFNERRWFDSSHRGTRIDATHLNVMDYWSEYDRLAILSEYYNEDWTRSQLYMNSTSWNPSMQRYIEILIESSTGRPVLQFNRVDLRLSWLKARFPNAKILHIFRHPRDQWCSTLMDIRSFPRNGTLRDFESTDRFYLLTWGRDLQHCFPFITNDESIHPYELFYQIWLLSYLFGRRYSDLSISFEELLSHPATTITTVLTALCLDEYDLESLASLVQPVSIGKWITYADQEWFSAIEAKVDIAFANYFEGYPGTLGRLMNCNPI
jgi:Sulfotransferase family